MGPLQTCPCELGCLACSKHHLSLFWHPVPCISWQAGIAILVILACMAPPCGCCEASYGACHALLCKRVQQAEARA